MKKIEVRECPIIMEEDRAMQLLSVYLASISLVEGVKIVKLLLEKT
jgi:hypothetical protein